MNDKKKKIIAAISIPVFMVVVFFAGFFVGRIKDPDVAALEFIVKKYKAYYLETDDDFVGVMADSILDRYSQYYSPEEYAELQKAAKGIRGGVGISFISDDKGVTVYDVLGNSPAERAEVKIGSLVTGLKKSENSDYINISELSQINDFLKDLTLGEKFNLKAIIGSETTEYELAREEYTETYVYYTDNSGSYRFQSDESGKIKFVRYSDDTRGVSGNTAYCLYKSFNGNGDGLAASAAQIDEVLKKFKADGKKKLILDLRNNGGGYMDIAEKVARHFVGIGKAKKPLIAKAVYKDGKEEKFYSASVDYPDYGFEAITILANSGTASASEVLIGAMLDYDTDGIVKVVLEAYNEKGTPVYRTYGKGIMQTTFPNYSGGGAIKLTTAKLYWAKSGISIHGKGVTKNIEKYGNKVFEPEVVDGTDYAFEYAIADF